MTKCLYFDDLQIGDQWSTPTKRISGEQVRQFASLTGDYNPLHWDEDYARQTPFGQPIAHGLLGLSVAAGLGSECPLVETVAFLGVSDWRFLKPIYHGDEIHLVTEVVDLEPAGRKRGRVRWKQTVLNQHGQCVQEGLFETLISRQTHKAERPAAPDSERGVERSSDRPADRSIALEARIARDQEPSVLAVRLPD
jgi:3-hydroxybutyryl-CoA dehydratase